MAYIFSFLYSYPFDMNRSWFGKVRCPLPNRPRWNRKGSIRYMDFCICYPNKPGLERNNWEKAHYFCSDLFNFIHSFRHFNSNFCLINEKFVHCSLSIFFKLKKIIIFRFLDRISTYLTKWVVYRT